ncbi:MAG: S8 family serine peptidase [Flavobacteriales bacterium]|nr:S8 family serine peptidase [Flavobacteriales bacterium]
MMNTKYFSLFFIGLVFYGYASAQKESPSFKYAVFFKDKANSPYSIDNPEAFLSTRAIERRNKSGIRIAESDLPVNPSYIKQVLSLGFTYYGKANWNNYIIVGTNDEKLADKAKKLSSVKEVKEIYSQKLAKKDFLGSLMEEMAKTEKKSSTTGDNLQSLAFWDYGTSMNQVSMLGIDYMHAKGYTGEGMIIAILDGGFYKVDELAPFYSLRENNQILATWDFVMNEASVYEDNSHGMSVLSCIAGVKQGQLIGTGPKAKFFLLRSEDAATETIAEMYYWEAAAVWADSAGADIINSSLGYTKFDNGIGDLTYADMNGNTSVVTKAADMAASKGILVVNSAGNEGAGPWKYIGAPADGDSVLSIGAVNKDRKIAGFSSRGPTYDGRIKPNVCAVGEGTLVSNTSGNINYSNGTSFSGPLIAGAAACLWQANPSKSNMEIYRAIEKSAHKYDNPDNNFGYGIPNFGYADMILKNQTADSFYDKQTLLTYPNPVKEDEAFVDFFAMLDGSVSVKVSDMSGVTVFEKQVSVFKQTLNRIQLKFPVPMRSGTYVVSISEGSKTFTGKFVKQ